MTCIYCEGKGSTCPGCGRAKVTSAMPLTKLELEIVLSEQCTARCWLNTPSGRPERGMTHAEDCESGKMFSRGARRVTFMVLVVMPEPCATQSLADIAERARLALQHEFLSDIKSVRENVRIT